MDVTFFIEQYNPTFKAEKVSVRPDGLMDGVVKASHYLCSLTTTRGQFVAFYSMGSAHKKPPTLADFLESITMDSSMGELTYKEACRETGEVVDRQAWESCRNARDGIIDTFGRTGFADLISIEF